MPRLCRLLAGELFRLHQAAAGGFGKASRFDECDETLVVSTIPMMIFHKIMSHLICVPWSGSRILLTNDETEEMMNQRKK